MSNPLPPPGWYPDPSGKPGQQYWNGHVWAPDSQPTKPKGRFPRWAIAAAAVVGLIILSSIFSGHHDDHAQTAKPTRSTSASAAPNTVVPFDQQSTLCPSQCHSTLFPGPVLPDGSYRQGPSPKGPDSGFGTGQDEIWHIPLGLDDALTYLRSHLPVNASANDGLPWCELDTEGGKMQATTWQWEDAQTMLSVRLEPFFAYNSVRGSGSEVIITRWSPPSFPPATCGKPEALTGTAQPPVPGDPLKSQLLGVEMPDGSTFEQGRGPNGHSTTGQEFWYVPGNLKDVTTTMSSRLPIHGNLNGIPWCLAQNAPTDGSATWEWVSSASDTSITVDVMPTTTDATTRVMVTADQSGDREGCENP